MIALTGAAQESLWHESMSNGKKFTVQGHFSEAEKSYLSALEETQKFGERNPRLLSTLNELAAVYQRQSKYREAEALHQRILGILRTTRGKEDGDFAITLNNLAALAYDQGQYARAQPLFRQTLTLRERILGPDHADVAESLDNLALLYSTQGQCESETNVSARHFNF